MTDEFLGRPRVVPRWAVALARIALVLLILADVVVTATIERPDLLHPTVAGDVANYAAGGERLNAGHNLYGPLLAGDRPVPGYPKRFPAPLLSPPLVAVIWRPLALFGDSAVELWWLVNLALVVGLALAFAAIGSPLTLGGLIALVALGWPLALMSLPHPDLGAQQPLAVSALSGNLNGYLLALCIVVWWATSRGRSWLAGSAAALAAVLKLGPFALGWWMLVRRDWTALKAFTATVVVLGVVGLLGAGLDANLAFMRLALGAHITPTALSVPWMLERLFHLSSRTAGIGTIAATVVGLIAIYLMRRRPRLSFFLTLLVVIFSSPVVLAGNFALLLAAASPWAVIDRTALMSSGSRIPEADEPSGAAATAT
jgi:Glycosyltransferase family 87